MDENPKMAVINNKAGPQRHRNEVIFDMHGFYPSRYYVFVVY